MIKYKKNVEKDGAPKNKKPSENKKETTKVSKEKGLSNNESILDEDASTSEKASKLDN